MISFDGFVKIIVQLLCGGAICWLLIYLVDACGAPEPWSKIIKMIIKVFAVLVLINALLSIAGHPIIRY